MEKLINISELSKLLNLINPKNKKPSNYVLRYWEKKFKQIKPTVIKNRRYYSNKQVEIIKLIKFLLKERGVTINGVKSILKSNINNLDDYDSYSLKADYHKDNIKIKSKTILDKIKKIKKYGKKITH
ncbi:MAG: transcriptional regulator [Candidatus Pelagibacter sp.]|nr:transcriptional regulator [Candidatus Pelagibacter sp.]